MPDGVLGNLKCEKINFKQRAIIINSQLPRAEATGQLRIYNHTKILLTPQ
jgi:hypothetical protein